MQREIYCYRCTTDTFRPCLRHEVRWLDWERDYALAETFWQVAPTDFQQMWSVAPDDGYQFCAVVESNSVLAVAAIFRYADQAWELAGVRVGDAHRQKGYGTSVSSFATSAILEAGRIATCSTAAENIAMQRTAESIGFVKVGSEFHEIEWPPA